MKSIFYKLPAGITPTDVIEFINEQEPQFKDLCFYQDRRLHSKDDKVIFLFDPHHSVLEINYTI